MNFKNFRITYHLFLWITGLMIFSIIGIFAFNTYQYLVSNPKILSYFIGFKEIEDHIKEIKIFVVAWLWNALYVFIKIFVILIVRKIFKSFPVLAKWLIFWDEQNEIHPILGRKITTHLRYSKTLNFNDFMNYHQQSQSEANMLSHHGNKLSRFFKKYDSLYDKENS